MAGNRRIRVVVGGVFDILHVGHIHFLKMAKELGDELIVIVAHDETVKKRKGRPPINPAEDRAEVLRAIRYVDDVVIGEPGEISLELIKKLKPDVIALGPDQDFDCRTLKEKLRSIGLKVEVIRLPYLYKEDRAKTSKIIKRITEIFCD
ncbi:adenylyltransferase/cytidyltransferase family protein [Pyrococcus abyssi]|uniref:FAD synthase n=1 Tax=Pyrococcus abyssi (strain GE5 / Orsay) TaxID=272844 RepID=RIBL_PYRAB|nr:adenylyltransferase/cytidyltransferase family protein [Pyrococcus abyssi]Q9UZ37.1 RecName: Full=FAD synthase; AltName: Full=FMN adenylyltransferase; AltName: Full=Flavin adenine dinucleotide synthase [Pyrococcus abyssi GE5]CAB50222.1 taqD glycerol-3-phosphate cytidyltransferase, putative [Pyrococcus abyssi GE5]CCE70758.1 TPA: glycerol-3-phosphate cytidyltransferase, putative [Pyrococcus abyssi GE5]